MLGSKNVRQEKIYKVKKVKRVIVCPNCNHALFDMKIDYDTWTSLSNWKKEIYKRICNIVSVGTYFDNDVILEKCLCCDTKEDILNMGYLWMIFQNC